MILYGYLKAGGINKVMIYGTRYSFEFTPRNDGTKWVRERITHKKNEVLDPLHEPERFNWTLTTTQEDEWQLFLKQRKERIAKGIVLDSKATPSDFLPILNNIPSYFPDSLREKVLSELKKL